MTANTFFSVLTLFTSETTLPSKSQTRLRVQMHGCSVSAPHLTGQLNTTASSSSNFTFFRPESHYFLFYWHVLLFSVVKRPPKYVLYVENSPLQQLLAVRQSVWKPSPNKNVTLAPSGGTKWQLPPSTSLGSAVSDLWRGRGFSNSSRLNMCSSGLSWLWTTSSPHRLTRDTANLHA